MQLPANTDARGAALEVTAASEYRRDPITGRWVIIAPVRSRRPLGLASTKPHPRRDAERDSCPFCEGREDLSPPETLAYRSPGSAANEPGWSLRVVPNKYPAVSESLREANGSRSRPAFGRHEVVVECPFHETNPARFSIPRLASIFTAYRDRMLDYAADQRIAYVSAFKNVGAEAGASLAHSHSQLLALPLVPDEVQSELEGVRRGFADHGHCLYCDMIERELQERTRVVAVSAGFVVLAPYASRFAYELWILPRDHESQYESLTDAAAADLAGVIKPLLGKLDMVLSSPAYNWYIRTGPARAGAMPHYHWQLQLFPRTTRVAGFEWATGCFINAVPPERAAAELREAEPPPEYDVLEE